MHDALRFAEQNSPMLRGSQADASAARAAAVKARAMTLPQLSANGFGTSGNNGSILAAPVGAGPQALMGVPSGSYLDGNLMLMAPLFAPAQGAMAKMASSLAKSSLGDVAEARAQVAFDVTEAFDRVLLADEIVRVAESKVAESREMLRTSEARLAAGEAIEATVQRSLAELSQAERLVTSAKNERSKAVLDLASVMGADLSVALRPMGSLDDGLAPSPLENYVANAKKLRGLILAAKAKLDAANADVRRAASQRDPQLYGVVMGDATNRSDMGGLSAGLTLSIPLIDSGQISGDVAQAMAMRARVRADLRLAEITVERQVREALLDLQTAGANIQSAADSVKAVQSAYDVIALRVRAGKSILVEQLDALQSLTSAKGDLAQARFDQALAAARLIRAAGGKP